MVHPAPLIINVVYVWSLAELLLIKIEKNSSPLSYILTFRFVWSYALSLFFSLVNSLISLETRPWYNSLLFWKPIQRSWKRQLKNQIYYNSSILVFKNVYPFRCLYASYIYVCIQTILVVGLLKLGQLTLVVLERNNIVGMKTGTPHLLWSDARWFSRVTIVISPVCFSLWFWC